MRTHQTIIDQAGGVRAVHERLGLPDGGLHTVRSWRQRGSIPPEYWPALVSSGATTLEELAETAKPRKRSSQEAA